MDPATLMQLLAHLRQQGQAPGQMPQMPPMGMDQGQTGQMPQMAAPQQPQGQLPSMATPQAPDPSAPGQSQGHHGLKFNPLMLLSPMGGLFASSPKTAMSLMSPAFGIANLLGAFK